MSPQKPDDKLDDRGTTPEQARAMLQRLRDELFNGSEAKTGQAMGYPEQQILDIMHGNSRIDDDFVMKMRGLAKERGVNFD